MELKDFIKQTLVETAVRHVFALAKACRTQHKAGSSELPAAKQNHKY